MDDTMQSNDRSAKVYEMAVLLLGERSDEEGYPDTAAWTTGSEIAHRTGIDKSDVLEALREMHHTQLYIRESLDVGHDIEVLGVVH